MEPAGLFDEIEPGRVTSFDLPHALVGANPNQRQQDSARRRRDSQTAAGQLDAGLFEDPNQGSLFE